MCLTFWANEFAKERRQLWRNMATGDGVGELNTRCLLRLTAPIEHGQGQIGALLQDTWYALKKQEKIVNER